MPTAQLTVRSTGRLWGSGPPENTRPHEQQVAYARECVVKVGTDLRKIRDGILARRPEADAANNHACLEQYLEDQKAHDEQTLEERLFKTRG